MTTLNDMIDEVLLNLRGLDSAGEGSARLVSYYDTIQYFGFTDPTDDPILFTWAGETYSSFNAAVVQFYTDPSKGEIIEINNEMMRIIAYKDFDVNNVGVIQVERAYLSTPSAHEPESLVRVNPTIPTKTVKKAINDTIKSMYPRVFGVGVTNFTVTGVKQRYDLPSDVEDILAVQYLDYGASEVWRPVRRWSVDNVDTYVDGVATKSINIYEGLVSRPVQVVYSKEATTLENTTDAYTTTGLPNYSQDAVIYGACWRLMSFIDAGKTSSSSAAQAMLNFDQYAQAGTATNLAKYYLGMFNQRVEEISERLRDEFPPLRHHIY